MKTLIDGYNLIFECGLQGRKTDAHSLARGRIRLLRTIARILAEDERRETVVVFDAEKQIFSGQRERDRYQQIQVLYALHYFEADDMIEHLIDKHSAPKQLLVVSSDHRIQKAALRRRAATIDCGDWYDELLKRAERPGGHENQVDRIESADPGPLLTDSELAAFQDDLDQEGLTDEPNDWPELS